jgi:anti-sigma factor RsiW
VKLTRTNIECRQAVELVSDYLDGKLSRTNRRTLERHLSKCDGCTEYVRQMRITIELTGKVEPDDLEPSTLDGLVDLFQQYQADRDRD